MTYDEYISIASEIKEIETFLAEMPPENVIDRMGLMARLELVQALIADKSEPKRVQQLTNDAQHSAALARIETLFDAKPGTPEGDELDRLVTLVEAYEQERFPIATSSVPVSQSFAPAKIS